MYSHTKNKLINETTADYVSRNQPLCLFKLFEKNRGHCSPLCQGPGSHLWEVLSLTSPTYTGLGDRQRVLTVLSVLSRAGLGGARRGVECPELGGEGLARVEVVREGGSEQLLRYRPRESRPELDTRLSSSSARCSVVSFSS